MSNMVTGNHDRVFARLIARYRGAGGLGGTAVAVMPVTLVFATSARVRIEANKGRVSSLRDGLR
jgi:hypothetical protein